MKIPLYAPDSSETAHCPYEVYHAEIRKQGFTTSRIQGIQIFAGEDSILDVWMIPLSPDETSTHKEIQHTIKAHHQWMKHHRSAWTPPKLQSYDTGPLTKLHVPSHITIHLGEPDQTAQDLSVPFVYYLKNTACSQCYPTWSQAHLKSMIWAQIITVRNLLSNKTYRSQGYDFDVIETTDSLLFEKNRNLFLTICAIVDELQKEVFVIDDNEDHILHVGSCSQMVLLLQEYLYAIARYQNLAIKIPFSAYYDEQTKEAVQDFQSRCLLSPTGIVQHQTWNQICWIYSSIDPTSMQDLPAYPGKPLQYHDHGEAILLLQKALHTLSSYDPAIPSIIQNGTYDQDTQYAVRTFQKIFDLPVNGIVDHIVWHTLFQLSKQIKQDMISKEDLFDLYRKQNSSGESILTVQQQLQTISKFYSSIPAVTADGFFGEETIKAVIAFQRLLGLYADGVLNFMTRNNIHQMYEELLSI